MKVTAIVASTAGGRTDHVVREVLAAAGSDDVVELHHLVGAHSVSPSVLDGSDAVVFGTPVYRASYAGVLKEFLDRVPRGTPAEDFIGPLLAAPVAIVATGGSDHHFLAVNHLVAILAQFFGAYVLPPLYRSADLVADNDGPHRTGKALIALACAIKADPRLAAVRPGA